MTLSSISNPDGICSHGLFTFVYTFIPNKNDGNNIDFIGFTVEDGNGTPLWAQLDSADTGSSPITRESASLPFGTFFGGINDITARPVIVRMYDTTLTNGDINGWTTQMLFDELDTSGKKIARLRFDPSDSLPGFCSDLPFQDDDDNDDG